VLRGLLDPPIPATQLDRSHAARSHTAEQGADHRTGVREGVDEPPHRRTRLLAGVLFQVLAPVAGLRHGSDMAVKLVALRGPRFAIRDHLATRPHSAIQKNRIPRLFEQAAALGSALIVGVPDEHLLELIPLERLVEPLPALPELRLAPEDRHEIRPARRPPPAPLPVEPLDILWLPRLIRETKGRIGDQQVTAYNLGVVGQGPGSLPVELCPSRL